MQQYVECYILLPARPFVLSNIMVHHFVLNLNLSLLLHHDYHNCYSMSNNNGSTPRHSSCAICQDTFICPGIRPATGWMENLLRHLQDSITKTYIHNNKTYVVDGSEIPNNHLTCAKLKTLQIVVDSPFQLVSRISKPSTVRYWLTASWYKSIPLQLGGNVRSIEPQGGIDKPTWQT